MKAAKPMNTVTRKDIATAAGMSVKTVARHERNWGIHTCRSNASRREALYFRDGVNSRLIPAKIITKPI